MVFIRLWPYHNRNGRYSTFVLFVINLSFLVATPASIESQCYMFHSATARQKHFHHMPLPNISNQYFQKKKSILSVITCSIVQLPDNNISIIYLYQTFPKTVWIFSNHIFHCATARQKQSLLNNNIWQSIVIIIMQGEPCNVY